MDNPRRNFHLISKRKLAFCGQQKVEQFVQMNLPAVKVDLQGANSGGQINDPGKLTPFQPLHQGMDTKAEIQIQNQRTVLYQDVRVAGSPVDDAGPVSISREFGEDGFVAVLCAHLQKTRRSCGQGGERFNLMFLRGLKSFRLSDRETAETEGISRLELSEFPEFRIDHDGGTDETAQAGSIWSKQNGHIPREIDRAHRVGIVMEIRRMKTCFTAVRSSPFRLRSDQSDPCPVGIIVNFPVGGKKGIDVFGSKKVGSAMGSIEDCQAPIDRNRSERVSLADFEGLSGVVWGERGPVWLFLRRRRTSPARRTRPPCPPNRPSAKVDLLSRYSGTSRPPFTRK